VIWCRDVPTSSGDHLEGKETYLEFTRPDQEPLLLRKQKFMSYHLANSTVHAAMNLSDLPLLTYDEIQQWSMFELSSKPDMCCWTPAWIRDIAYSSNITPFIVYCAVLEMKRRYDDLHHLTITSGIQYPESDMGREIICVISLVTKMVDDHSDSKVGYLRMTSFGEDKDHFRQLELRIALEMDFKIHCVLQRAMGQVWYHFMRYQELSGASEPVSSE
jgi:hypothetical protein